MAKLVPTDRPVTNCWSWVTGPANCVSAARYIIYIESDNSEGGAALLGEVQAQLGETPEDRPPVFCSTGRLTGHQAGIVNRWRARLALDRPLPGADPVSRAARMAGLDDRPRASCSDCIAVAVAAVLAAGPDPMALARYAEAAWQAHRAAAGGGRDGAAAPVYPGAGWYLPAELADVHAELRDRAWQAATQARWQVAEDAGRRYPGKDQATSRDLWYHSELARLGIPSRAARVPRGVIARMAIDAWASHTPDEVCAAAVAHAAQWHDQPHRARRDMLKLQR